MDRKRLGQGTNGNGAGSPWHSATPTVTESRGEPMSDDLASDLQGRRATATIDGKRRRGTITSVTYTPKKGDMVVALDLDDSTPNGNSTVALALDDIDPAGDT